MNIKELYTELMQIKQDKVANDSARVMFTTWSEAKGKISESLQRELIMRDEIKDDAVAGIIASGKPELLEQDGKSTFVETFYPQERLILLGAGHIALPLAQVGEMLGFSVVVVDDRISFANEQRFPWASEVKCESFDSVFDGLQITQGDYIVVITRGHKHDTKCLRAILSQPESIYVGMIGSRKRVGLVKEQLVEEGYDKARIERVCTPIGLSIGAVTPEEISISILAEVIKRKRVDSKQNYEISRSNLDMEVVEKLTQYESQSCCVVTIIDTKGSVPRGGGAKMVVNQAGQVEGSIGGGCSEAAVIHEAVRLIGTGEYRIKEIDMTGEVAEDEGMVCGGIMKVLMEDFQ